MKTRSILKILAILGAIGFAIALLDYRQDEKFYSRMLNTDKVPNFKIEKTTAGINPFSRLNSAPPGPVVAPTPKAQAPAQKKEEAAQEKKEGGEGMHIDGNLLLARALDVRRNHLVIGTLQVEGRAEIKSGVAYLSGIVLHKGTGQETAPLDIEGAVLNAYGYFKYEHPKHNDVMGIVSLSGEGGAKIRFSNGPLANAHLDFVTSEKYSELAAKQSSEYQEVSVNGFALPGDEISINGHFRPEYLPYVKEPNLSREQMRSIASEVGFSF